MDLAYEYGGVRHDRWCHGWVWGPYASHVTVGQFADGRWYAERTGRAASRRDKREGACVYGVGPRGEHYARATVRRWMRMLGAGWVLEQE